jgi:hypothetical protein
VIRLLNYTFLLAQQSNIESMGSGLRGKRDSFNASDLATMLMVLAAVASAIWILAYATSFREQRWARSSSLILFIDLCRTHGLRWSEGWLLWREARSQRLSDAPQLFLDPECLEEACLRPSLRSQSQQIDDIRARLFADLEDEVDEVDDANDVNEEQEPGEAPQSPTSDPADIPSDLSSWLLSGADLSPKD